MLRIERIGRKEIIYDFNKDVYYFRYLLDIAINGKKNIILDKESLTVKH